MNNVFLSIELVEIVGPSAGYTCWFCSVSCAMVLYVAHAWPGIPCIRQLEFGVIHAFGIKDICNTTVSRLDVEGTEKLRG